MKKFIKAILNKSYARKNNITVYPGADVRINNNFGGANIVYEDAIVSNSRIGYGTYIGGGCKLDKVEIGKYCSFGENIKVISAAHPSDTIASTHPAFYSTRAQAGFTYAKKDIFDEYKLVKEGTAVVIGNDVFIGDEALILGGVTIGHGAIIGAGAVVTKDVAPYEIVGGVPAKKIGSRFDDATIEKLLELKWWDKPESWLREHADDFADAAKLINIKE